MAIIEQKFPRKKIWIIQLEREREPRSIVPSKIKEENFNNSAIGKRRHSSKAFGIIQ
ncbi:hypothetical protein GCM10011396_00390 [Undibacterium terreum]|uniref:Uncharacterized protein n=1 Tax=Undibacterium terreum TaxID=1224302 RepID=A0A916U1Z0_9BURK|nr:hypothetical protein GCM10011396_00390 [Undibacterium terreum]